jgi:O-acetyl-ADP-ribose deacetylase (regulator of RNase III)
MLMDNVGCIIFQEVFNTVTELLQKAANKGLKSVALTPLGVGRRFQYDSRTVAEATVTAIVLFLATPNSLKVRLQEIVDLC